MANFLNTDQIAEARRIGEFYTSLESPVTLQHLIGAAQEVFPGVSLDNIGIRTTNKPHEIVIGVVDALVGVWDQKPN